MIAKKSKKNEIIKYESRVAHVTYHCDGVQTN